MVTVTGINLLTGNNLTDVTFIDSPHSGDIKGNITSLFLVGCVVGAMIVSVMADYLGRKRSILVGGLLFAAGGALQAGALDYAMFIAGRVISGLGIGVLSMVVPVYISETAPTKIRGRLIAVQQLMVKVCV